MIVDRPMYTQREVFEPPELPNHSQRPDHKPDELCAGRSARAKEEQVEEVSEDQHREP